MLPSPDRRDFLKASLTAAATAGVAGGRLPQSLAARADNAPMFKISLAEWSLHRTLRAGEMTNLDFPGFAKSEFAIDAVEYVNQFFADKATDTAYLKELQTRCADAGVKSLLIMVDGEGALGDAAPDKRTKAIENHYKWVEAAKFLGCHSIRVNAQSSGTYDEQLERAADGLRRLAVFSAGHEINVIVENHGGLSSNGKWLASVIKKVDLDNCGTLPDFGNFRIGNRNGEELWYDRYQGVQELMPFAKAVSAKSHEFNEEGNETNTDYFRMMTIVLNAGYRGYVGIEWEGDKPDEVEGIRLTQRLLERVRKELA